MFDEISEAIAEVVVESESEEETDAKFSIFDVNKELHLDFKYTEFVHQDDKDAQSWNVESAFIQNDLIN